MPRGRPASLPNGGHRRPATVIGLVATHVNEKGTKTAHYDFSKLPVERGFQLELVTIFARRANPTGKWRNLPSSKQGFWALDYFTRWLAQQSRVPRRIADIDPATWLRWRLEVGSEGAGSRALRITRMLLLESWLLSPETRREVVKRIPRERPQESSYSDDELRAVTVAARRVWRGAYGRIRHNLDHLTRFRAGAFGHGTQDHLVGAALEHIAMHGDVPRTDRRDHAPERWVKTALGGAGRDLTWKRLYLDDAEVMAALVLLAVAEGWNSTSIEEMAVPERLDGGSSTPVYRVELEKRRRRPPHRYETRTLTDHAPDTTARLLGRIIEATQPARDLLAAHGHPTDRLLLSRRAAIVPVVEQMFQEGLGSHARETFRRAGGQPVNLRRVRKAVNNRYRREPNQNSRGTHESVYLLSDEHTVAESEATIARGIQRAVSHAETVVAVTRRANADLGEDTPTASCTDHRKSPFEAIGVPCSASFLLCLGCRNAVIMPRHLGRLAYLFECMSSIRGSVSPAVWQMEWSAHFSRLESLRRDHYSEGQWEQARTELANSDRMLVDLLIEGDLDS